MLFPNIVSPSFTYFLLLILLSSLTRFLLIWFFHPKYFFSPTISLIFIILFLWRILSRNLSPPLPFPLPFIPTRESTGELLTAAGGRGRGGGGASESRNYRQFPFLFSSFLCLGKRRTRRKEKTNEAREWAGRINILEKSNPQPLPFSSKTRETEM